MPPYHLLELHPQLRDLDGLCSDGLRLLWLILRQCVGLLVEVVELVLDGGKVTLEAAQTTLQRDHPRQVVVKLVRGLDQLGLLTDPSLMRYSDVW